MRDNTGKYRAKRADNGEWVYGWLVSGVCTYIITPELFYSAVVSVFDPHHMSTGCRVVDPDTVGEFAGDVDGSKGWEHDVFNIEDHGYAVITWNDESCGFELHSIHGENFNLDDVICWHCGNLHDQPELMQPEEES